MDGLVLNTHPSTPYKYNKSPLTSLLITNSITQIQPTTNTSKKNQSQSITRTTTDRIQEMMRSETSSTSSERGSVSPKSPLKSRFKRLLKRLSSSKKDETSNEINLTTECGVGELEQVFRYFDENGDGKISPSELQSCVRNSGGEISSEEAEAAVGSTDSDGDGYLGFEDFAKLMEVNGDEEKIKDLKEAFRMYEMEGQGCITPKSLKMMLHKLGESKTIEDCKVMIRMFDLNGDGVLSFEEFTVMMQ